MANSDIDDSEQLLGSAQAAVEGPIRNGIDEVSDLMDALEQETNALTPVATQLNEDVERFRPYADMVSYASLISLYLINSLDLLLRL